MRPTCVRLFFSRPFLSGPFLAISINHHILFTVIIVYSANPGRFAMDFLRVAVIATAAVSFSLCHAAEEDVNFNYYNNGADWPDACATGKQQSPIAWNSASKRTRRSIRCSYATFCLPPERDSSVVCHN